ncbi:acyl-CoA N-acyltransferase [Sporodiniella umbellata]|nr:acyl-CoA N-acyltransferase [Sporodiniella umbellata]
MELTYTPATLDHLKIISQYEQESYHPDEAASEQKFRDRIGYAAQSGPELFLVAQISGQVAGFVCSTLSHEELVTDESMESHEHGGRTVCLHSVCVSPSLRHKGIATQLLKHWISLLRKVNREQRKYNRISLLSRPTLLKLYENVGFVNLGKSKVVHGPEPWFDCILEL